MLATESADDRNREDDRAVEERGAGCEERISWGEGRGMGRRERARE